MGGGATVNTLPIVIQVFGQCNIEIISSKEAFARLLDQGPFNRWH